MNFESLIGNNELKNTLNSGFNLGRLPHAIILQGDDGLGKHTLAKLIAMAAVCRSDKSLAPCGTCPSCVRALALSHPDIRVVEGTGASNSISVDSIKSITEDAYRKPEEGDYNVYLLFAENKISEAAQNKLLKIIEEPPDGTLFIITIKSADTLLPTIRSRAGIFTLHEPRPEEAVNYIVDKFDFPYEKVSEASMLFGGNIGKMLNYLNGTKSALAQEIASKIASLIDLNDENELLSVTAPMIKDRTLFCDVTDYLAVIFRDACVLREGATCLVGTDKANAERLSQSQTKSRLIQLPDICTEYKAYCQRNANMNLLITALCAKLRSAVSK